MSLQNLTNFYEVIKTLKFELKPSIYTYQRVKFNDFTEDIALYEDYAHFFQLISPLASKQRSVFRMILQGSLNDIVIHKDLVRKINVDLFYKLKQGNIKRPGTLDSVKLSVNNTLSGLIKSNPEFKEQFFEYIEGIEKTLGERLHKYNSYIGDIGKVYTKTDKGFAQKQFAYIITKAHDIMQLFPYKTSNYNHNISQLLKDYFSSNRLESLIEVCHKRVRAYNPKIGYELHSFGLNAKAINKKVDVSKLEKEKIKLETEMDKLEEELFNATQKFDEYTKYFNDYVIYGKNWDTEIYGLVPTIGQRADQKLQSLRNSQSVSKEEVNNAKIHLKSIRDGNFDYGNILKDRSAAKRNGVQYKPTITGDETFFNLKLEKIDLSVRFGRKKGKFFAKQQELFHQEKLTHYARLMRDGNSYFVVMIDRDNTSLLDNIEDTQDHITYEIMTYNSLTIKAVEKLIFERDALQYGKFHQDFNEAKKIWEKRSYKKKGEQDTKATTPRELVDLKKLVHFLNIAITQLNITLEDNIFDWNPFKITEDFNDFNEFRKYVTKSCYHLSWSKISKEKICQLDQKGDIDVYQIYNKDFIVDTYCAITDRDKNSSSSEKKTGKPNLFTKYWQSLFEQSGSEKVRLHPESRLYIRAAKSNEEIDEYILTENGSKLRFRQDKIIGDFQLIFYPTKDTANNELQNTIISKIKGGNAIGIDLGENSLAMICLIDNDKKVILDKYGKPIVYDLTMINIRGEFVEEQHCVVGEEPYRRKSKLIKDRSGTYFLSDGVLYNGEILPGTYFSSELCKTPIKELSLEQLTQALQELEKLSPDKLDIRDKHGNKVFDYAYAFEHLRTLNKIRYHLQTKNSSEEEQYLIEKELLETTTLRNGYTSQVVSLVTRLAKAHNAMTVFENLDQKSSQIKGITLFAEQPFEKVSSKEKRLLVGISPYQIIQNKIIQKCNYLLQKEDKEASQLTPRFKRVEDIRQLSQLKEKDCAWGSVIFVNEENSSQECPNCGFDGGDMNKIKIIDGNILEYDFHGLQKIALYDEKIKERKYDNQTKKSDLVRTRVKYTDLVKNGDRKINGDPMICIHCGYDTRKPERVTRYNLKSCDEIAAYIIAKRGIGYINSDKVNIDISPINAEEKGLEDYEDEKIETHLNENSPKASIVFKKVG